eukprot:INCI15421.2.p1 GENE.INCI15421.2~~INCI15421.2.p1  ORF type:complete len:280 (+),score=65.39 INCI15421.2:758-1597(+)
MSLRKLHTLMKQKQLPFLPSASKAELAHQLEHNLAAERRKAALLTGTVVSYGDDRDEADLKTVVMEQSRLITALAAPMAQRCAHVQSAQEWYTNAAFYLASVITAINAVAVALGGLGVTDAAATDFENVNYTELLLNEDARSQFVASFTNPVTWCNLATICIGVLIVVCQKRSKILEKKLKAWNAAVATSHEVTAEFRTYLSVVNFTSSKAVNAELDTAELKKATKAALSRFMNEEFQRHRLKVADMLNKAMDESARLVPKMPAFFPDLDSLLDLAVQS